MHKRFFDAYDARLSNAQPKKRTVRHSDSISGEATVLYDVKVYCSVILVVIHRLMGL